MGRAVHQTHMSPIAPTPQRVKVRSNRLQPAGKLVHHPFQISLLLTDPCVHHACIRQTRSELEITNHVGFFRLALLTRLFFSCALLVWVRESDTDGSYYSSTGVPHLEFEACPLLFFPSDIEKILELMGTHEKDSASPLFFSLSPFLSAFFSLPFLNYPSSLLYRELQRICYISF